MNLPRAMRLLPVLVLAAGTLQARPVPASQTPGRQQRPAIELEDRATPDGYGNPFLWACLADLMRGHLAEGEQNCTRAIDLDKNEGSAYELRGYAYLIEHRYEHARADFLAALKRSPGNPEDLAGYAQSLTGLGQFDAAVAQFGKALARAPGNAAYLNGRCWARAGTGKNLQQALIDCNNAIRLAPGAAAPLNSRGLVQLRLRNFGAAIEDYSASLAANKLQASPRFGRGLAHLGLGHSNDGAADINNARHADPEIDGLFVSMGVLPSQCPKEGRDCPAGFPPPMPSGKWLVAKWLAP